MDYKLLKRSRVAFSLLALLVVVFVFVDLYELIPTSLTKIILYLQFVPSLLTAIEISFWVSLGFVLIILITLVLGRVYCSFICPLGVLQDAVAWIAKKRATRKSFYKYKKQNTIARYSLLAIVTLSLLFGFTIIVSMLDPYSIAGRFFTYLLKPTVILINNALAGVSVSLGWSGIYQIKAFTTPIIIIGLNLAFAVFIGYLAYKRGRWFCNTICPVGTILGFTSKFAWIKIKIDANKCSLCSKCAGVCKSECIDLKKQTVDDARCVSCYNCLTVCKDGAINLMPMRLQPKKENELNDTRRQALAGMLVVAGGLAIKARAQTKTKLSKTGKALIAIHRKAVVTPPGSENITRFNHICTACGLCISSCPTKVLSPALTQYGIIGFMQPFMNYADSECSFDCTICSDVCPTGALVAIDKDKKHVLQLGKAIFVKENCIVYTDETACGACSEHCPTKAVNMVPYKGKLLIPLVNQDICVGCGACEHPCPLEPAYKAIYVDGNPLHLTAQKPKDESKTILPTEDFPF